MPEKKAANQRDLGRLEEWDNRKHMKFSQDQCPDLHQGRSSSFQWYRMRLWWLRSSSAGRAMKPGWQ